MSEETDHGLYLDTTSKYKKAANSLKSAPSFDALKGIWEMVQTELNENADRELVQCQRC